MKIGQWPILGLLLVVLFLGHDLLMAGEVHAAPRPEAGLAHHESGAHADPSPAHAPQTHEPTPAHPDNCQVGQLAVPRSNDAFNPVPQHVAVTMILGPDGAVTPSRAGNTLWEEPHWPPGTRRALFQVYRI